MRQLLAITAWLLLMANPAVARAGTGVPADASGIAREAYLYGYPMVENYLSIYQFALNPDGNDFKGPPNAIHNVDRVFSPADRGVVTPNSDTPYSFLVMDLRREPLVVTLPPVESGRYYSLQLVDLYSHNVDYIGTRKDGNGGGDFLIAGPNWDGEMPEGIVRTVRMPTELVYSQFRTQLYDADDLGRVREIQSGYAVQPLSVYVGGEAPPAVPEVEWPEISRETAQANFWSTFNFLLQFAPPLAWEEDVRGHFAQIGVAPSAGWPATEISRDLERVVIATGNATRAEIGETLLREVTSSRGLFGSPEAMRGQYMQRALGAMGGLYGLEEAEALYETYLLDAQGARLNAATGNYEMRFTDKQLPPAEAFWSVTLYDGDKFLFENALDRYLINSSMLEQLKANENGDIVLYLQHAKPGPGDETNWLPAPAGEFGVVLRIYLPGRSAIDGTWTAPPINRVATE